MSRLNARALPALMVPLTTRVWVGGLLSQFVVVILATMTMMLQGCGSPAPVEDRDMAGQGAVTAAPALRVHVVAKGETLNAIARRYAVTPAQLQQANRLADIDQLEVGQRLRVPIGGAGPRPFIVWPLKHIQVSSEYGARKGRHKGIDLVAAKKTVIRASAAGKVVYAGKKSGYGKVVILQHGADFKTLYAHNHKNKVKQGQRVKQGQVIATVGHTGRATGSHVHFETIVRGRQRNPRLYVLH